MPGVPFGVQVPALAAGIVYWIEVTEFVQLHDTSAQFLQFC